jgi:hypothetical protein
MEPSAGAAAAPSGRVYFFERVLLVKKSLSSKCWRVSLASAAPTHEDKLVGAGVLGVLDELDVSEALEGLAVRGSGTAANNGEVELQGRGKSWAWISSKEVR